MKATATKIAAHQHGKPDCVVQPKLTINAPGDRFEQEADAMADRVMRMPFDKNSVRPTQGLLASSVQRKCAHCEEEEKQQDEMPLMRKAEGGGFQASPGLAASLNASKGGGSPLPEGTRRFMEQAFSADFSRVRVHADGESAEMSGGIGARAFTHGSDIYFNRGQYSPVSSEGKRLLGHELIHTIQQGVSSVQAWGQTKNAANRYLKLNTPKIQADSEWYNIDIPFTDYEFDPTPSGILNSAKIAGNAAITLAEYSPAYQLYKLYKLIKRAESKISDAKKHVSGKSALYLPKNTWNTIRSEGFKLGYLQSNAPFAKVFGLNQSVLNIFSSNGAMITTNSGVLVLPGWILAVLGAFDALVVAIVAILLSPWMLLFMAILFAIILIAEALSQDYPHDEHCSEMYQKCVEHRWGPWRCDDCFRLCRGQGYWPFSNREAAYCAPEGQWKH